MEKQYNPAPVEQKWYDIWIKNRYFHADEQSTRQAYSIVIPPPNVTGILHMGHALNNTIQDICIRHKRMSGLEALWLPGTDHAGIATQNVVERKLAKERKTRHDLGREAFVAEVWKWKEQYSATIIGQLKKLGSSCDWDRERFTMDEGLSKAVRKVFVDLFNQGLIYRGKYIINWCPRCRTALSDEEINHQDLNGKLYHFKYPYADGSGHLIVATTRPETLLGDTAVAVNPTDSRYSAQVGKLLNLPLTNRQIPVITDDVVDKEFGTGAVKVTPAHDPNDFAIGQRHAMTPLVIMNEAGIISGEVVPEKYNGMDRFVARKAVVADMEALGLVEKIEPHAHAVGHCYRCSTVVEPYYSNQWFVKMKPLAQKALEAAQKDEITFYPVRWKKTYIDWMENIRDWCISRQIWWGHQIPVWLCEECLVYSASEGDLTTCPKCGSKKLVREEDVLDTWFSSWLWPFSTMGWPDKTATLDKFYPTNTLVTAPEILFFWVARMLMAGLHFTGKLPFTEIVLHGTVRDKTGKKMSKSLGNAIDPLEVIATHGTDALRFSLVMITAQGADVFLGKDTFDIGRNFCNKLWNAARFLLSNIETKISVTALPENLTAEDRWILSMLNRTIGEVQSAIVGYRCNEVCHLLYDFVWKDFCDWYVEAIKADLYNVENPPRAQDTRVICGYVLGTICKLLHPAMPFITEEIWQHLQEKLDLPSLIDHDSIMKSSFPVADPSRRSEALEAQFDQLRSIISSLRTIRSENNIPPDKQGEAVIIPVSQQDTEWFVSNSATITSFAKLSKLTIALDATKPEFAGQAVVKGTQIYLELEGLIDRAGEIARLTKEIAHGRSLVTSTLARLASPAFTEKAPADIVEKERQKCESLKMNLEKLEKNLEVMSAGK